MLRLMRSLCACLALLLMAVGAGIAHADTPDQDLRLQAIGYRLASANATACKSPAMLDGLLLHDISGYAPGDREAVRAAYGLTGGFGVLGVVPGSGAERAGLRFGDEIIALGGRNLAAFDTAAMAGRASYARTEAFLGLLEASLQTGPAILVVQRNGGRVALQMQSDNGCGGRFALMHQSAIDAWSDGRYVAVTERLAEAIPADNQLAFIVAHEMAHNILGHANQSARQSRFFVQLGLGAGNAKAEEIAADRLAVELMARGGFDPQGAAMALRRVSSLRPMGLAITHPSYSRRISMVTEVAAQLNATAP